MNAALPVGLFVRTRRRSSSALYGGKLIVLNPNVAFPIAMIDVCAFDKVNSEEGEEKKNPQRALLLARVEDIEVCQNAVWAPLRR